MLSWGNNRRLTDQSNSHQFSELLECVQVDLGKITMASNLSGGGGVLRLAVFPIL